MFTSTRPQTASSDDETAKICMMGCAITIMVIFIGGPAIAALVIASTDGGNTCQGHDATNLDLKTWLTVDASVNIAILGLLILSACVPDIVKVCIFGFSIAWALFSFAWWIIGIVILSRSHGQCIAHGDPIGIMTVCELGLHSFTMLIVSRTKNE